jgi:uncharacterized membrane protein YbaN (DUF454 family)
MAMSRRTRSLVIQGLGWTFMVLGVLGLFLPILQGILFLAIGMVLLSYGSPWFKQKLISVEKRFPKYERQIREARIRAMLLVRRFLGSSRYYPNWASWECIGRVLGMHELKCLMRLQRGMTTITLCAVLLRFSTI